MLRHMLRRRLLSESLLLESQFGTVEKLLKRDTPPAFKNALKTAIEKVFTMNSNIIQDFSLNGNLIANDFFTLDLPSGYILYKMQDVEEQDEFNFLTPEQQNAYKTIENNLAAEMPMINDSFQKLRAFNQVVKSVVGDDNADTFVKILNLSQVKGTSTDLNRLTEVFQIINSKGGVHQKFDKKLDTFINNMLQLHIKWFNVPYRNQETVKPNIPMGTRILNYFDLFTILADYINNSGALSTFALFSNLKLHNTNFIDYLSQDFQNNLWDIFLKEDNITELYKKLKAERHKNSSTTTSAGYFAGYHGSFINYCIENNHWIPMKFDQSGVRIFLIRTYEGTAMACNILPYETDFTADKSDSTYADSVELNPHFFVNAENPKNKNKKLRSTTDWCIKSKDMWKDYSSSYWQRSFLLILDNNLSCKDPAGAILTGLIRDKASGQIGMSEKDFMNASDENVYNAFMSRDYAVELVENLETLNKDNLEEYFSKDFQSNYYSKVDNKINLFSDNLEQEISEAQLVDVLGFEVTSDEKTQSGVTSRLMNNQSFDLTMLMDVASKKDVFNQFFLNLTEAITNILTQDPSIHFLKTENNIVSHIEFFNCLELFNNPVVNSVFFDQSMILDQYIDNNLISIRNSLLNIENLKKLPEDKLINNLLLIQPQPVESNFKFDISSESLQVFNQSLVKNKIEEIKQLYIDRCLSEFNSLTDDSIFNIIRELFYDDAYENDNNEVGLFFKDPNNMKKFVNTFFKVMQPLIVNKINENFNQNEKTIQEYLQSIDKKIVDRVTKKLNSLFSIKKFKVSQELKLLNTIISKKYLTDKSTIRNTNITNRVTKREYKNIPISLLFQNYEYLNIEIYKQKKNYFLLPVLDYIKKMQFYVSDEFLNANFNETDKNIIIQSFENLPAQKFIKSIRSFTVDDLINKISNEDEEKQYKIHTFMFLLNNFFNLDNKWKTKVTGQQFEDDNFRKLTYHFGQVSFDGIDFEYSIFNRKFHSPEDFKEKFMIAYRNIINSQGQATLTQVLSTIFFFHERYLDPIKKFNYEIDRSYITGHPSLINYLNYLYSDNLGDIQSNFQDLILTKLNEFQTNPIDIFSVAFISLLGLALIFTVSFKTKVLNGAVANILYNAILQIEQQKIANPNSQLYASYKEQMDTVFMFFYLLQNFEKIDSRHTDDSVQKLAAAQYVSTFEELLQKFKQTLEKSGYVNKTSVIQKENINYIKRNQKIIISEQDFRKLLLRLL